MKAKTMKRVCGLLLTAVLAVGIVGCGQDDNTDVSKQNVNVGSDYEDKTEEKIEQEKSKDPVTLEVYYGCNGIQKDTQKVEDALNELLKEYEGLEHVTVHLNTSLQSEYAQDMVLAQSAGKQIDVVHSYGLDYYTEVKNGSFLALNDYLNAEEFSELYNELPEWLWSALKVDDTIYCVPGYQMGATDRQLIIPDEYLQYVSEETLEKLENFTLSNDAAVLAELAEIVEEITVAVREGTGLTKYVYPLTTMLNTYNFIHRDVIDSKSGIIVWEGETTVENYYFSDVFKEACREVAEWVEEGLFPADAALQDKSAWRYQYLTQDNAYALDILNSYGGAERIDNLYTANYGYELTVFELNDHYFIPAGWAARGWSVSSACKHAEEALLFIEALNTEKGKEIYNLLVWGIEGEHYEKVDDNRITTLEYDSSQGNSETTYAAWKWLMGNTKYTYLNQEVDDDEIEVMQDINENSDNGISLIMGFAADLSSVETEVSQCRAVVSEYSSSLTYGTWGADWEKYYNEFVTKMEAAGVQTIIDEVQAQLDAFLAQ